MQVVVMRSIMYPSSALDMAQVIAREQNAIRIATKAVYDAVEEPWRLCAILVVVGLTHAEGRPLGERVFFELQRVEGVKFDVLVRRHRRGDGPARRVVCPWEK